MKLFPRFRRYFLIVVALFPALTLPDTTQAALSCNAQSGITTIGAEWVAKQCIPNGVTYGTSIYYETNVLKCPGSTVELLNWYRDNQATPASLASYWASPGYRVFINSDGSHIVAVDYRYTGLVAGYNMENYPAGNHYCPVNS